MKRRSHDYGWKWDRHKHQGQRSDRANTKHFFFIYQTQKDVVNLVNSLLFRTRADSSTFRCDTLLPRNGSRAWCRGRVGEKKEPLKKMRSATRRNQGRTSRRQPINKSRRAVDVTAGRRRKSAGGGNISSMDNDREPGDSNSPSFPSIWFGRRKWKMKVATATRWYENGGHCTGSTSFVDWNSQRWGMRANKTYSKNQKRRHMNETLTPSVIAWCKANWLFRRYAAFIILFDWVRVDDRKRQSYHFDQRTRRKEKGAKSSPDYISANIVFEPNANLISSA